VPTSNEPVAQEGDELLTQSNLHSLRFSLNISVYQRSLAVFSLLTRERLRKKKAATSRRTPNVFRHNDSREWAILDSNQ
jgi:hypothetical protein